MNITVGEASKEFGECTAGSQLERVVHVPCGWCQLDSIRVRKPRGAAGGTFIFRAQIEKLLPSFLQKIAEK